MTYSSIEDKALIPFSEIEQQTILSSLPAVNELDVDFITFEYTSLSKKRYTITYWRIEVLDLDSDSDSPTYEWFYFEWETNDTIIMKT